jgi:hypothetical protein
MRQETQNLDYWLVQQRIAALRFEAIATRGLPKDPHQPQPAQSVHSRPTRPCFTGLHIHLGRLLIVIGRTLTEDQAGRPDPVCS